MISENIFKDKFVNIFCFLTRLSIEFSFHVNVLHLEPLYVYADCELNDIGGFHLHYSTVFIYSHGPQNTKVCVLWKFDLLELLISLRKILTCKSIYFSKLLFFYDSDTNHFLLEYLRIWLHPVIVSYPYITATQIKRYRNAIPKFNILLPQFPLPFQGFIANTSSPIQVSILYLFSLASSFLLFHKSCYEEIFLYCLTC